MAQEYNEILRRSTFKCTACGSGSENFLTLFADGTCTHCGNPAGVVVETSHPEDIEKIKHSVVVVAPKEDYQIARKIMNDLLNNGISVIDPTIVVANEQEGNRANVLSFITDICKYILVIPPDNDAFSDDGLVSAAVEHAFTNHESKVIPLYPDTSYRDRHSFLSTRMGVQWQGTGEKVWDRERFIDFLKKK